MLKAYFDDSGTHAGSKAVVWAGFMADEEEWTILEKEWRELLERKGLRSFHMTELEKGVGQCRGWSRANRDEAIHDFREVIRRRDVIGIGGVIRIGAWNKFVKKGTWLEQRLISPVHLAYELAIQITLGLARSRAEMGADQEKVFFFFDRREEKEISIGHEIAIQYKKHARWRDWYEDVAFLSMKDNPALQTADMLAYQTYQLEMDRQTIGSSAALRAHLEALIRNTAVHGVYYDEESLGALIRDLCAHERPDLLNETQQ